MVEAADVAGTPGVIVGAEGAFAEPIAGGGVVGGGNGGC